jgi:hypothetical protein
MSDQAERIHAALLRLKAQRSPAVSPQVTPCQPEATAPQLVVINEQNLAALTLSTLVPARKLPARSTNRSRGITEAGD